MRKFRKFVIRANFNLLERCVMANSEREAVEKVLAHNDIAYDSIKELTNGEFVSGQRVVHAFLAGSEGKNTKHFAVA
jgi:hypothetical protein